MCDYCDCRSHPEIAALSADHEVLLALLADLRRATDAGDAERAEMPLGALLDDHVAREESDLFPAARQLLAPGQWDAVDNASADDPATARPPGDRPSLLPSTLATTGANR